MFYIKNIVLKIFVIFFFLAISSLDGFAQEVSLESLVQPEQSSLLYTNKKTSQEHARGSLSITQKDGVYFLERQGYGNYDKYQNVQWTKRAEFIVKPDVLEVQKSITRIYDQERKLLVEFRKVYDYESNTVSFQRVDQNEKVEKEKEFSIKGPICDDVTMIYFLRALVANYHKAEYKQFYLLTNEPKLYEVNMKQRESESLPLAFGEIFALKFQLMANLGPLTETAARLVPPTFVWYTTKFPYHWLQYEGLESGFRSANIQVRLVDKEPPVKLAP